MGSNRKYSSYTLTGELYRWLKAQKGSLTCERCGKPILPGDEVKSRRKEKHYHLRCWQQLLH